MPVHAVSSLLGLMLGFCALLGSHSPNRTVISSPQFQVFILTKIPALPAHDLMTWR